MNKKTKQTRGRQDRKPPLSPQYNFKLLPSHSLSSGLHPQNTFHCSFFPPYFNIRTYIRARISEAQEVHMARVSGAETSTLQWSGSMFSVTGGRNAAASSLFPFFMSSSRSRSLPPSVAPSLSLLGAHPSVGFLVTASHTGLFSLHSCSCLASGGREEESESRGTNGELTQS